MRDEVRRLMRNNTKRDLAESLIIEQGEIKRLGHLVNDARADERQAMTYLQQCRDALGHDGDFPSLVERLREIKEAGK